MLNDEITQLVGSRVLSLITAGMYTNPLSLYREYIQNAADSLSSSGNLELGKIEIIIEPTQSQIIVRDNGPGLSRDQAIRDLLPIARSRKSIKDDRGFRGIGRLAGLAFGESVEFITRQTRSQKATKIKWDGRALELGLLQDLPIDELVSKSVTIETIDKDDFPDNFFQVKISDISRFAAARLLNVDLVRDYIAEVCPVPFNQEFLFASEIESLMNINERYATIDIFLNEEELPVTKRLKSPLEIPNRNDEEICGLEEVVVPAISSDTKYAAIGWIAHWTYSGAVPKVLGVRGIRARVGNIQIGDEQVFDHLYSENRFNRWCIGEIHILDPQIVPNSRRDYFESSPHLRNLENHLRVICRQIEQRCRNESKNRNKKKRYDSDLHELNSTYDLIVSGYLTPDTAIEISDVANSKIQILKNRYQDGSFEIDINELNAIETKLSEFRSRRDIYCHTAVRKFETDLLCNVFSVLAKILPSHAYAHKTIESILCEVSQNKTPSN